MLSLWNFFFDIFDVTMHRKAPEAKIQKRQRKRKGTERIDVNLKRKKILTLCRINLKRWVLYTLLVNINGYVSFLINTPDTVVKGYSR